MTERTGIFDTSDRAVLGGWIADTRNVPEGGCLVYIPGTTKVGTGWGTGMEGAPEQPQTVPHGAGDRVHVTIEFDVTLEHGSTGGQVNRLIQTAFDGVAAGMFKITGRHLVLIDDPKLEA